MKLKYSANDGKLFDSKEECVAYEELPRLYYAWNESSRFHNINRSLTPRGIMSSTKFFLTHEDTQDYIDKMKKSKKCDGWTRVHSIILYNHIDNNYEESMIKSVEDVELQSDRIIKRASSLDKILNFINGIIK